MTVACLRVRRSSAAWLDSVMNTSRPALHLTIGLTDYYWTIIGWTNGLSDYRTRVRVRVRGPIVPVSPIVRCIIKCDPH